MFETLSGKNKIFISGYGLLHAFLSQKPRFHVVISSCFAHNRVIGMSLCWAEDQKHFHASHKDCHTMHIACNAKTGKHHGNEAIGKTVKSIEGVLERGCLFQREFNKGFKVHTCPTKPFCYVIPAVFVLKDLETFSLFCK